MSTASDEIEWSENEWTARLRARLGLDASEGIGIGDDAALVRVGAQDVVVATDVLVSGRHFHVHECGIEAAVYKALAVNLSDFAAVAAIPTAFVLGVVLPLKEVELTDELLPAIESAVDAFSVPCVGGDTNVAYGADLTLSVTVIGRPGPHGFVPRSGAQVGDVLSVTGPLGGSLESDRHLRPVPRLAEAQALAATGCVHAMIDISDGLSTDLPRLCDASGVGATIEGEQVPIHDDVPAGLTNSAMHRLDDALDDGEDFELLVAHAPFDETQQAALRDAGVTLYDVGRCEPKERGCGVRWQGTRWCRTSGGFDHFA